MYFITCIIKYDSEIKSFKSENLNTINQDTDLQSSWDHNAF